MQDERQSLVALMNSHLAVAEAAADDNEFVDIAEARRLHGLLQIALADWEELSAPDQEILASAVSYFVHTDDDENDLRSPIGFEDDAEVVEGALAKLRRL